VPGDLVDAAGVVLTRGPNHVAAPCPHFDQCGGCQLQHVAEPVYQRWLGDRIVMALRQHGLTAQTVAPALLSPPRSRRRASLRAIRTANGVVLGFNTRKSHQIIDVQDCLILHPRLQAQLAPLRLLLKTLLAPGKSALIELLLAANGVDLILADLGRQGLTGQEQLAAFADSQDLARLSLKGPAGIDIIVERRAPRLEFGGVSVLLPPGSFTQATEQGEADLIAAVRTQSGNAARIADLFCGIGTFALPLSCSGTTVLAADAAGPAVNALARAAKDAGRSIETAHRDLFRRPFTAKELDAFDCVVLDPPRAGAEAQCQQLAASTVAKIVYVSCNPNTFARDAAMLVAGGYTLGQIQPVGQFLWSTHVELVATFFR
jgi:23S rRNA (uracil1939-C5)-methyltransferase